MEKLYRELFYVSQHGKVRNKVLFAQITLSVILIIFFLSAMGLTAYAYFSSSVTSSANTVKCADYDLTVTVTGNDGKTITVTDNAFVAEAGKSYHATLTYNGTASTGFCIVTVGKEIYHTQQIWKEDNPATDYVEKNTFLFTITVSQDTRVTFTPSWGTSSKYNSESAIQYITDDKNNIFVSIADINSRSFQQESDTNNGSYIVKDGDMLSKVANIYGTTAYNGIENHNEIPAGQKTVDPPVDSQPATSASTDPTESPTIESMVDDSPAGTTSEPSGTTSSATLVTEASAVLP